jgi:hypothetical protein
MNATGGVSYEMLTDSANEQTVLAAAYASRMKRTELVRLLPTPDFFLTAEHSVGWELALELERRNLDFDPATAKRLVPHVDVQLLVELVEARPDVPANLDFHVRELMRDRVKATVLEGPLAALLEGFKDRRVPWDRLEAIAQQIASSMRQGEGEYRYVRDPRAVHRDVVSMLDRRFAGEAVYGYGIPALDMFESVEMAKLAGWYVEEGDTEIARMMPGTAPKQATVLTAISGTGKTTFIGSMVLGLARQRRRVLVCSWEVGSPLSLEFLTELSLVRTDPRFSRSRMMRGAGGLASWGELRPVFEKRMREIQRYVRFMDNPFYRRTTSGNGRRVDNERHIDIFGNAISESGASVVVADLWSRMLVNKKPDEEELALFRQQSQFAELGVHGIVVTQQKHKELMQRADKRPTADNIKGSGGYLEFADTAFGLHRPGMWKEIDDNRIEVYGFKQRGTNSRFAVSIPFDPHTGLLGDVGKTIPYDPVLVENEFGGDEFLGGGGSRPSGNRRKR